MDDRNARSGAGMTAATWWPSPFGEDDERGMLNHITDVTRLAALASVREGRVYDLGRVLDERVPVFPGRAFHQTLVTSAHHANMGGVGKNRVNWITEVVSGTTQLGTHLDALSHLQIGERGYNGWTVDELAGPHGVRRLGAETIPQIVTRGWLVDVAPLAAGDVIRPDDLDTWLAARGVALTGCDTWSYGPVPAEDPERPFEVPQVLNAHHGVFIVENLDLEALARDRVRRFCLVLTFPKLRGATGAWCSPIALV